MAAGAGNLIAAPCKRCRTSQGARLRIPARYDDYNTPSSQRVAAQLHDEPRRTSTTALIRPARWPRACLSRPLPRSCALLLSSDKLLQQRAAAARTHARPRAASGRPGSPARAASASTWPASRCAALPLQAIAPPPRLVLSSKASVPPERRMRRRVFISFPPRPPQARLSQPARPVPQLAAAPGKLIHTLSPAQTACQH